jgi:hypothetical protein
MQKLILLFDLLILALSHAQTCSIDWFKIAGGGAITPPAGNLFFRLLQ